MNKMDIKSRQGKFICKEYQDITGKPFDFEVVQDALMKPGSFKIETDRIVASDLNGLMYAMYRIAGVEASMCWASLIPYKGKPLEYDFNCTYEPLLTRRGNVLEVIDDIDYILKLISWMARNGMDSLFFTFKLWDKVKHAISDALLDRGIEVTLGGHSLKYLLNQESIDVGSFSFQNNKDMIKTIVNKVREHESIKRLSLWPEDVGIVEGQGDQFFEDYLTFTNALQQALPEIEVEHIAYNAGLNWEMLEPPQIKDLSATTNTLFAYWGRDYSKDIDPGTNEQQRANNAMTWWVNHQHKSNRKLCVFEYYSDFYMMSELYGPMSKRILSDISWYISKGVDSIINLTVPLIKGRAYELICNEYDYLDIHMYNNYVYTMGLWGYDRVKIDDLWFSQYGNDKGIIQDAMSRLEELLPPFTKYNVDVFPNRYVDIHTNEQKQRLETVQKICGNCLKMMENRDSSWGKWIATLLKISEFYINNN